MVKKSDNDNIVEQISSEFSATRDAAVAWIYALKCNPVQESSLLWDELLIQYPEADLEVARCIVEREGSFSLCGESLSREILSFADTYRLELDKYLQSVLEVAVVDYFSDFGLRSMLITEDALGRMCRYSDSNQFGMFKNVLQTICSYRSRTRRLVRMFCLFVLYSMEFKHDVNSADMLRGVEDLKVLFLPYRGDRDNIFGISFDELLVDSNQLTAFGELIFLAVQRRCLSILENRVEIDQTIQKSSLNWRIGRMMQLDLNILRLAVHEILYMQKYRAKTIMNDAVELAKEFGSEQTRNFVNGILQQVCLDNLVED